MEIAKIFHLPLTHKFAPHRRNIAMAVFILNVKAYAANS